MNAFHTQVTWRFFGKDYGGTGIQTCANIKQLYAAIGTYLGTAAAAYTFTRIVLFHHSTRRAQDIYRNDWSSQRFSLQGGRKKKKPCRNTQVLQKLSTVFHLFAQRRRWV